MPKAGLAQPDKWPVNCARMYVRSEGIERALGAPAANGAPSHFNQAVSNMKNALRRILALLCLVGLATAAQAAQPGEKYTFVLVHGATAGGWEWKSTGKFLADDGHTVYRATLTGLGERMHLNSTDVDLQTHINDVVNLILYEDLHDVVLTGHSYGGMVITGVIDRIPERIRHVVYLDAAVADDGMSLWDLFGNNQPVDPERFKDG